MDIYFLVSQKIQNWSKDSMQSQSKYYEGLMPKLIN